MNSIRTKLILSYILIIVFSLSILGYLIGNKSQEIVFDEITEKSERISELIYNMASVKNDLLTEKINTDLSFARKLLNNLGEIRLDNTKQVKCGNYVLPAIYAGNTNLTANSVLVDRITDLTGDVATIFMFEDNKLIRATTTYIVDENKAIGTYINSDSIIYKKIVNNESYYGRAEHIDDSYVVGYEPIHDKYGNLIGAIGLGYKVLNSYFEKTINDILIGKTGYVYVMNSQGEALIHPTVKGENLADYSFSKEIIKNKHGIIEYEFKGIYKLAAYEYFEPWDWYIVTTANYDDLKSSSNEILRISVITGIIIFLLAIVIAWLLANTLVKPINKLKSVMELASEGDLTVHADINSQDEIGMLTNSFNHMIKENKRLFDEAIKYERLKSEFFSNISHELKTPVNMIFATTQLMSFYNRDSKKDIDINRLDKHINIIKQNCYRLIRLINNLIDITRIDSHFIKVKLQNKDIVETIENITLSTAEYIKSKSRILIFDTEIEEKIMAFDPEFMERIMLNLISNAVKFTKPGDKIEVMIYDGGENILISVKDTGVGIPYDKQEVIFERFKQVDPLLSRRHEGSGIGLSLVKSLVEMHGGNISVKSECNKGSEFLVELPIRLISEEVNLKNHRGDFVQENNIEKIQVEFSDIYE